MKRKCRYDKTSPIAIGMQFAIRSRQIFTLLIAHCLLLTFFLVSCGQNKKERLKDIPPSKDSLIYYCPMHPEIVQHHPGKCPRPECKEMDLIVKTTDTLLDKVLKPVNTNVLASIKTIKPVYKKMPLVVQANGFIDFDTRTMNNISSLYSGRIEKLYVKYAYQKVNKGDILFEVYSPELVSAQQNLIYILNSDPDEKSLMESAKQKLILLGFTKTMVDQLVKSKQVMNMVPVYSKYEGHAHPVMDIMSNTSDMIPSLNYAQDKELSVKEGMYVMAGQTIFNIVDPHQLAVILQIKSEDIPKVTKGLKAEMIMEDSGPDSHRETVEGKIDFIDPFFKPNMKSMIAKIYMDNSKHNYKVGSLVKAKIYGEEFQSLWIPSSALVDLGKEKMVWLKENGNFRAKKVETGIIENGMVEIADGLTENSEIASEAHYLIDSEGFVKENTNEE